MDPITLTAISMGATALGTGVGAFGAAQKGEAEASMYKYQSGIAQMNEKIAKQDADYARSVGEVQAQDSGMKTRFTMGKIASGQAAGGLDINAGSNTQVRESQQDIGTHDQAVIRSDAAKRAYGYEVEAAQASAQGKMYEMAGEQAKRGGKIAALTSILGGAASVSNKWMDAKRVGIY